MTAYARDVLAGSLPAGRYVRLACERHLRDLHQGRGRGLRWDLAAAKRAINYFRDVLRLNGGEHEGKPFRLMRWQAFIVGSLFGWKTADGVRRFRTAYNEVAKGNGKSPMAAGTGMLCLTADGEARAEVYSAAAKKDQAMILFRDAVAMMDQSPDLKATIKTSGGRGQVWNLAYLPTESFFRPIASDDAQSGPRPHCALIDELHEHKDPTVLEMMRAGTKGRRQALIFEITNSGFDRHSICYQHHTYSVQVLERVIENDAWFAYIAGLDVCEKCRAEGKTTPTDGCAGCDDWRDPAVWIKANPNLGVSITEKYLREQVHEALGMPAKQNTVKRLNFCIWTEADQKAIPLDLWDRGGAALDPLSLRGRKCYGGMDLAKVDDLSSFALLFPPLHGEPWKALVWFWVPEADIGPRSQKGIPYDLWAQQGFLRVTQGNTTDFGFIAAHVLQCCRDYKVLKLGYDPVFAGEAVQTIQAEVGEDVLLQVRQGFLTMAAPTAELLRLIKDGKFQHGGHPILRWNASNLTVATDPVGNMKPDKARSQEKIDGITAIVNALACAMLAPKPKASVYETRGPLIFG